MDEMENKQRVILLAQQGLSDAEIAERLNLRTSTVKTYRVKGKVFRRPYRTGKSNDSKLTPEWILRFSVEWRKTVNHIRQYCGKEKLPPTTSEVNNECV